MHFGKPPLAHLSISLQTALFNRATVRSPARFCHCCTPTKCECGSARPALNCFSIHYRAASSSDSMKPLLICCSTTFAGWHWLSCQLHYLSDSGVRVSIAGALMPCTASTTFGVLHKRGLAPMCDPGSGFTLLPWAPCMAPSRCWFPSVFISVGAVDSRDHKWIPFCHVDVEGSALCLPSM